MVTITREEFIESFKDSLTEMYTIMLKKNKDYAGEDNPFANFELVESLGLVSMEKGILVRMTDKIARISNLIDKEAAVHDEAIEDTLSDLANYSVILKVLLEAKSKQS